MRKIIFINVNYNGNAGDFWCTPMKYYNFSNFDVLQIHFMDVWHFLEGKSGYEFADVKNEIVILGGGGLLTTNNNFIQQTTEHIIKNNKVIVWGLGTNTFETPTYDILSHPNVILAGIRDIVYGVDIDYLPCVSCKHSLFDKLYEVKNEIGVIEHPRLPINIEGFEKISNQSNIEQIIHFIGSHETILSSTFHGTYWSQLLNKKVLYVKSSDKVNSKIINMKHRVEICDSTNYESKIGKISSTNDLLFESRHLNDEFYKKVIKLLENL